MQCQKGYRRPVCRSCKRRCVWSSSPSAKDRHNRFFPSVSLFGMNSKEVTTFGCNNYMFNAHANATGGGVFFSVVL
jgi:hypothetical protein